MEYESNVMIVKVDTDDEYEFAQDMQVLFNIIYIFFSFFLYKKKTCNTLLHAHFLDVWIHVILLNFNTTLFLCDVWK